MTESSLHNIDLALESGDDEDEYDECEVKGTCYPDKFKYYPQRYETVYEEPVEFEEVEFESDGNSISSDTGRFQMSTYPRRNKRRQSSQSTNYDSADKLFLDAPEKLVQGSPCFFCVNTGPYEGRAVMSDIWKIIVVTVNGEKAKCEVADNSHDTPPLFTFTPSSDDDYIISVTVGGYHIKGSPATCHVSQSSSKEPGSSVFGYLQSIVSGISGTFSDSSRITKQQKKPALERRPEIAIISSEKMGSSRKRSSDDGTSRNGQNVPSVRVLSSGYDTMGFSATRGRASWDYESPIPLTTGCDNVTISAASASANRDFRLSRNLPPPPTHGSRVPETITSGELLQDIVSRRTNKLVDGVNSIVIGPVDDNVHIKIVVEAFKYGIEKEDIELLDVVIPRWTHLNKGDSWHPMIQIAKCNKASLFTRLSGKPYELAIPEPHDYFCSDANCHEDDSLKHALLRLNTFIALAQPAHLLSKEDPMREAFELRTQMLRMSTIEKEFQKQYLSLSEEVEQFCYRMANLCGRKSELEVLLDRSHIDITLESSKLGTIEKAFEVKAKEFVAHDFVQRHLHEEFYGKNTRQQKFFLNHSNFVKFLIFVASVPLDIIAIVPYILFGGTKCLTQKIIPCHYVNALRVPILKFYFHIKWYSMFLVFLLVYTLLPTPEQPTQRNTTLSWLLCALAFYILGYAWAEMKQMYSRGYKAYFSSVFNWLDSLMIILYAASFASRAVAMVRTSQSLAYQSAHPVGPYPEHIQYYLEADRRKWLASDPEIVADCLFAIANLLSFARLSYILPVFERLGPLLVILGKVLTDTMYFLALFVIVFLAFLIGIHNLYKFYADAKFSSITTSFVNMFWAVFAMADHNLTNSEHASVEVVGFLMFGTFHVLIVIMLLNMLIAMLSSSYEDTDKQKDVEWKYARARLRMDFMAHGETLPAPFNIIPSVKSILRIALWLRALCREQDKYTYSDDQKRQDVFKICYMKLMKKLKMKYAKSFLQGQEIVSDSTEENREEVSGGVGSGGGGDGYIIKATSNPVYSNPSDHRDEPGVPDTAPAALQRDPLKEILLKYLSSGTFPEPYANEVFNHVIEHRDVSMSQTIL